MKTQLVTQLKGQIAVLFAVVLVVLLGFTALAVDGALVYSDKRTAQSVADAAALAGAGMAAQYWENHQVRYDNFACNSADVLAGMNTGLTSAISRAATNNFTIEANLANENGVEINCHIEDIGPYFDQYIDVKVMITSTSTTSFAQMFNNTPMTSTVTSVARVHPRTNLGFGYAVASVGPNCSTGGVTGRGNIDITTDHGGIFSNSCMDFNGNVTVHVNDPMGNGIRYVSSYSQSGGSGSVTPAPVQSYKPIVPEVIPTPDCSSLPTMGNVTLNSSDTQTIDPGNYGSITLHGSSYLTMNPGLYCISGGINVNGSQKLTGNGVTLYFLGGGFSAAGGSEVNLSAPLSENPPALRGLLMYTAPGNNSTFTIAGNNNTQYVGTIYVPTSTISAVGTSGMPALQSQLIGQQVEFSGSATVSMDFSGALNYQIPSTLDLNK